MRTEYRSAGCAAASCWKHLFTQGFGEMLAEVVVGILLAAQLQRLKTHSAFIPISCVFSAVNSFCLIDNK